MRLVVKRPENACSYYSIPCPECTVAPRLSVRSQHTALYGYESRRKHTCSLCGTVAAGRGVRVLKVGSWVGRRHSALRLCKLRPSSREDQVSPQLYSHAWSHMVFVFLLLLLLRRLATDRSTLDSISSRTIKLYCHLSSYLL